MTSKVKKEIEKLIKKLDLNCSVKEFKDKVDWNSLSLHQKLSEDFIREFKDKGKIKMAEKITKSDLVDRIENKKAIIEEKRILNEYNRMFSEKLKYKEIDWAR